MLLPKCVMVNGSRHNSETIFVSGTGITSIVILHLSVPTALTDVNTRLQFSDISFIPPLHGGFLAICRNSFPPYCLWWRHQMETFSVLLADCARNSPVTSELHAQRPVTRCFDVYFDLSLNKRLSKQSCGWWFEMLLRPSWRHCNGWSVVCLTIKATSSISQLAWLVPSDSNQLCCILVSQDLSLFLYCLIEIKFTTTIRIYYWK